jgi:glyoxylase-like metal-dependent hydrolase (beta-lactamase superfamily II)
VSLVQALQRVLVKIIRGMKMKNEENMIFRQLFDPETSTYTYVLADPETMEGVIIDPVIEKVDRDLQVIKELGLKLLYTIETHVHADHVTSSGYIREKTGAKSVIGSASGVDCADIYLGDDETLKFGRYTIRALSTPGHTNGCTSYHVNGKVFSGDTLFVRGTGRTDFQQGSSEKLFKSVTEKLFSLPPSTLIYPGHDYKGQSVSTIEEEKKYNPRINSETTLEKFVTIMDQLKLPDPKKIHEAVPANLVCGAKAELGR